MLWPLCILIGLALGQHLKITPSSELSAFISDIWAAIERITGEIIPWLAEWRDLAMIAELRGQRPSDAPSIADELIGKLRGGTK
ncbi:MAG: hypothetical protein RLZZ511_2961 [Cyanobacteriota bacterium]|jgi:hypothetical protein